MAGILGSMFPNGFMPSVRNNSDMLMRTGIGLISGRTGPEQAAMGGQAFLDARQGNRTLQYLQKNFPELAPYVQAGVPAGELLKMAAGQKLQAQMPPKPTDTMRNLEWRAQQAGLKSGTPEYAEFMRAGGAGTPGVEVNIAQGGSKFSDELQKGVVGQSLDQRGKAVDASKLMQTVNQGREILDSGAITGAGANWKVGALKWAQTMGVDVDVDAMSRAENSQAFQAVMGNAVASIIKQFGAGTGLSDADRRFAQQIAAGDITLTEPTIRRVFDIAEKSARAQIDEWNNTVPSLLEGDIGSLLSVPPPGAYTPPQAPRAQTPAGYEDAIKLYPPRF